MFLFWGLQEHIESFLILFFFPPFISSCFLYSCTLSLIPSFLLPSFLPSSLLSFLLTFPAYLSFIPCVLFPFLPPLICHSFIPPLICLPHSSHILLFLHPSLHSFPLTILPFLRTSFTPCLLPSLLPPSSLPSFSCFLPFLPSSLPSSFLPLICPPFITSLHFSSPSFLPSFHSSQV